MKKRKREQEKEREKKERKKRRGCLLLVFIVIIRVHLPPPLLVVDSHASPWTAALRQCTPEAPLCICCHLGSLSPSCDPCLEFFLAVVCVCRGSRSTRGSVWLSPARFRRRGMSMSQPSWSGVDMLVAGHVLYVTAWGCSLAAWWVLRRCSWSSTQGPLGRIWLLSRISVAVGILSHSLSSSSFWDAVWRCWCCFRSRVFYHTGPINPTPCLIPQKPSRIQVFITIWAYLNWLDINHLMECSLRQLGCSLTNNVIVAALSPFLGRYDHSRCNPRTSKAFRCPGINRPYLI